MYFSRFAVVKLTLLSDRMFLDTENERFDKTLYQILILIF
jgi:hypothetical protein